MFSEISRQLAFLESHEETESGSPLMDDIKTLAAMESQFSDHYQPVADEITETNESWENPDGSTGRRRIIRFVNPRSEALLGFNLNK